MFTQRVLLLFLINLQLATLSSTRWHNLNTLNYHRYRSLVLNHEVDSDEIDTFFYNLSLPIYNFDMKLRLNDGFNDEFSRESKLFVMILSKFPEDLMNIVTHQPFFKTRDHTLLIIESVDERITEKIERFFKECFSQLIINVGVVIPVNKTIQKYSYNGFLGNFLQKIDDHIDMFADKTKTLHGYQLIFIMYPDADVFLVNGKGNGTHTGIDGYVGETLVQALHATRIYRNIQFGLTLNTKTSQKTILDLQHKRSHVCFNSRELKMDLLTNGKVEATYPHDRNDLVILVPRNKLRPFKNLQSLAKPTMYVTICAVYLLFYLYLYFMADEQTRPKLPLSVYQMMFGMSPSVVNVPNSKYMFLIYGLFSVVMVSAFQSKLASILTAPDEIKQMKTIQDLIDSNLNITSVKVYTKLLNATVEPKLRQQLVEKRMKTFPDFYTHAIISSCRTEAVLTTNNLALIGLVIDDKGRTKGESCYKLLEETLVPTPVVYIVGWGSPFLDRINSVLFNLMENGLYIRNKNKILINLKLMFSNKRNLYDEHIPLSMKILDGSFKILLIGIVVGFVAFVGELGYFHYTRRKIQHNE